MPFLHYPHAEGPPVRLFCKKYAPETVAAVLDSYRRGTQPTALSGRFRVPVSTIENWVAKTGHARSQRDAALVRAAKAGGTTKAEWTAQRAEAEALYLGGHSVRAVAARLDVSEGAVYDWLRRRGVLRRKRRADGRRPVNRTEADRAALAERAVRLYTSGLSGPQVADALGPSVTYSAVATWLRRAGVVRPRAERSARMWNALTSPRGKARRARMREAWRLRGEGMRPAAIARALGVSPRTVRGYLQDR